MNVVTLAVALGLSGLFAILAWKAHSAMQSLRENLAIEAFFDPGTSSQDAKQIVDSKIKPMAPIASFTFTSREQALADYSKSSGEDVQAVLGMNPLPASIHLRLKEPSVSAIQSTMEKLRSIEGIVDVRSDLPLVQSMESRSHVFDRIALVAGGLLLLSALCFAVLTARFILRSRRETLRTLSMLGAAQSEIIGPLMLETGASGILGGIFATVILFTLQRTVLTGLDSVRGDIASSEELLTVAIGLIAAGLVLSLLGSVTGWQFRTTDSRS